MATVNPLNVFKGPDSLRKYFNPDEQPPLPLVELPEKLNPFRKDGVRIYAKLLTTLPCQNVKALPALNMLLNEPRASDGSIIEVSSGSTITSLGITARVLYNNEDTTALVSNKASRDRVRELQFFGIKPKLYGGPTYTETTDPRGPVEWARGLPKQDNKLVNLGQYDSVYNWKSHERWTGPQIYQQLPEINLFCMGMGSTGCVTGTGKYLKSQKSSVKVLGVCNAEADLVPGPREEPMHHTSPFPWKEVVDFIEIATSEDSYRVSMQLSREGIITGPSSGMTLKGLYDFLQKAKDSGALSEYADKETGEVSCVFVCCDLPQKHIDTYFQKLSPDEFPSFINEELFDVDQNVYSFRWEIDPRETDRQGPDFFDHINSVKTGSGEGAGEDDPAKLRFIDIRAHSDFVASHVLGASNLPLPDLTVESKSPFDFGDIEILISQSNKIQALIERPDVSAQLLSNKSPLVVLDYDGNTSRVMTAMLRARGVEAYSFYDGMPGLMKHLSLKN